MPSTEASSNEVLSTAATAGIPTLTLPTPQRSILEQAKALATIDLQELPADVNELPILQHGRRRFVLERFLHKKASRTSWIADNGIFVVEVATDRKDRTFWCCNFCNALYSAAATTTASKHLTERHGKREDGDTPRRPVKRARSVLDLQKEASSSVPIVRSVAIQFKELLIDWMVTSNVPFAGVEHRAFRDILMLFNPNACRELLPESGNTIRVWVQERYTEESSLLKQQLATSRSRIHLSFDLWTSPSCFALLGIVAHFIDSDGLLQNRLLGIRRVRGNHSGENVAPVLVDCLRDFAIDGRFGYFQSDNAESNNTCLFYVLGALYPGLNDSQVRQLRQKRRIRCFGHILNLVAKAFLEGDDHDLLQTLDLDSRRRLSLEEEDTLLKQWRKRGPIGKLHNIVHFIRRSPQRRDKFVDIVQRAGLSPEALAELGDVVNERDAKFVQLVADNDTRWNSVYLMIERALRLRFQIDWFCQWSLEEKDAKRRLPSEDRLDTEDWVLLTNIKAILEPVHRITKTFEGHAPRFGEVIATTIWLLDNF